MTDMTANNSAYNYNWYQVTCHLCVGVQLPLWVLMLIFSAKLDSLSSAALRRLGTELLGTVRPVQPVQPVLPPSSHMIDTADVKTQASSNLFEH